MKRFLPVLAVSAWLGLFISSAQATQHRDPFDRYLAAVRARRPEPSLIHFADECGVKVEQLEPEFAVSSASEWSPVKDLAIGVKNLDSDYFSTAQVWFDRNRVLVEVWALSLDVGSEARIYHCFVDRQAEQVLAVAWNLPLVEDSPGVTAWGYQQRWKRGTDGRMKRLESRFVDEELRAIRQPKLDDDANKSLEWSPIVNRLDDLKLPAALLR